MNDDCENEVELEFGARLPRPASTLLLDFFIGRYSLFDFIQGLGNAETSTSYLSRSLYSVDNILSVQHFICNDFVES